MDNEKIRGQAKMLRLVGMILGVGFLIVGVIAFIKKDYLSLAEDGLLGVFVFLLSYVIGNYLETQIIKIDEKENPPDQGF